jgi:hypothetical protein
MTFTQVFLKFTKRNVFSSNNTKIGSVQERTTINLKYLIVTCSCAQMSVEFLEIGIELNSMSYHTKALFQLANKWLTINFKVTSQKN